MWVSLRKQEKVLENGPGFDLFTKKYLIENIQKKNLSFHNKIFLYLLLSIYLFKLIFFLIIEPPFGIIDVINTIFWLIHSSAYIRYKI